MKYSKRGVPLTRNSETMTEAQFFSMIRSHARRLSIKWRPRNDILKENRRPYIGPSKIRKWEYSCSMCNYWFNKTDIEVDHIVECGSIRSFEDIGPFYERLLIEKDGYVVLCKSCHLVKTLANKIQD